VRNIKISGWIMDALSGAMKLAGWQWLFLSEGIPSILVGFWVIFLSRQQHCRSEMAYA